MGIVEQAHSLTAWPDGGRRPYGARHTGGACCAHGPVAPGLWLSLAVAAVGIGSADANAQTALSQRVEAVSGAAVQAHEALRGFLPRNDTIAQRGVAVERELVGCATNFAELRLWRVTQRIYGARETAVATVRGGVYPLIGFGQSDLTGLVDALLQVGRTDGREVTLDCLIETIVAALSPSSTDIPRVATSMAGGSVTPIHTALDDRLPRDWPWPDVVCSGGNVVVRFTILYLSRDYLGDEYHPIAYALVFNPQFTLLSWATLEGDPFPAP